MFQRRITVEDVRWVVENGETIEEYTDDKPYPSRLILGRVLGRAIHVVIAGDSRPGPMIVVTVYEPDPSLWTADFTKRRKRR